jgi:hypothetical protein
MTKEKTVKKKISATEAKLLEQLRAHPEIRERMESILELASAEEGPLKTADEVEDQLIEEIRKLGHTTMTQWAHNAEERVSLELRNEDPTVVSRKKKR